MLHWSPNRRQVIVIAAAGVVLTLAAGVLVGGWGYLNSVDKQVNRTDPFGPTPDAGRPPVVALEALNILVMGADSELSGTAGAARADSIILIHLPADRKAAQFISIPRDTWLMVPPDVDGDGGVNAKINAAFAWGQAPLMVRTVEAFTGVHLDHTVSMNFNGFQQIIDALGGIDVTVDTSFTSLLPPFRSFQVGRVHMDGATALDYARQRKQFDDGDFTRMRHQRDIVGAVFETASQLSILDGPAKLDGVIRSTAAAVTVDEGLSIFDMVRMLKDVSSANLSMLTSPSAGTGMVGDESVVFPDLPAAAELYAAVRTDTMDRWLATHQAA
jgi:LCP family protein required for cell wall assembly